MGESKVPTHCPGNGLTISQTQSHMTMDLIDFR